MIIKRQATQAFVAPPPAQTTWMSGSNWSGSSWPGSSHSDFESSRSTFMTFFFLFLTISIMASILSCMAKLSQGSVNRTPVPPPRPLTATPTQNGPSPSNSSRAALLAPPRPTAAPPTSRQSPRPVARGVIASAPQVNRSAALEQQGDAPPSYWDAVTSRR